MELTKIAELVFGNDYFEGSTSRILCKTNKKIFLLEVREWLEQFLSNLNEDIDEDDVTEDIIPNDDHRVGRVGSPNVYFTLDRSYGIVAINQEGLNVVAACRFASIAASCGVYSGKWMYELHLGSKGIMQIGWCSNLCQFTIDRGCGDTLNSYAFDGSRIRSWNMISKEYGELWKSGDVIGVCIDMDNAFIQFHRNGRALGIAYENLTIGSGMIYIPCVSLVEGESLYANFGARPLKYPVLDYQPLQKPPNTKVQQSEYLLKWLKNLTNLVTPNPPEILNCILTGDISDTNFWNRFYSALCYHINNVLCNRYCLFENFVPFIGDIINLNKKEDKLEFGKFKRIMDELGLYIREKYIDKSLFYVMNHLANSFKQISDNINCPNKKNILKICYAFMAHDSTRKYVLQNFLFDRFEMFTFLHHKPLDDPYLEEFIGKSWWKTIDKIPEIEANKIRFRKSFFKIEQFYNDLEKRQCRLVKMMLNNTDGTELVPCSRRLFLKKYRKFCWHELESSRNDLNSRLPTSVAYGAFLRIYNVLEEIWKKEIGDEPLAFPSKSFYDQTFKYSHCDRIGGLEHFLTHLLQEELQIELGADQQPLPTTNTTESRQALQMAEDLRAVGLTGVLNLLDTDENVLENMFLPSSSAGQIMRAIFAPLLRDQQEDLPGGNMNARYSLLELFEDLVIFFLSTVTKHCHKIAKAHFHFEQLVFDFNNTYSTYKRIQKKKPETDPLVQCLKITIEQQKMDLDKRAKKYAWVQNVLLTNERLNCFFKLFAIVLDCVCEAEAKGQLFMLVPDFYLEACDVFTDVLVRDFLTVKSIDLDEGIGAFLKKVANLMIKLIDDPRIKHIDCKKYPVNTVATLASMPETMKILESLTEERSKQLMLKLMEPYTERHWKATNWILVRFWHGDGFGFKYTSMPHHIQTSENVYNPTNYAMFNIACAPSQYYQNLVRQQLLDTNASIPTLLDSIIAELHTTFGDFLTPMQEIQRAIERNEQLMMLGRLYKMCTTYFDKTIALLRVLDMFIALAPEVFLESYYPESTSFTKRIIQVVLLIVHRISSKQGCFRVVMNSRITVLENVEYFPIETACIAVLLGVLTPELEKYREDDMIIPRFSRMFLTDPSYDLDSLKMLIGSPDTNNAYVLSLHDYENEMLESELAKTQKLLKMLAFYQPLLSVVKIIPDDELCTICYSAPYDVKFSPCGHFSCLACISYYISRNRACFFCKQLIVKVIRLENNEVIESLTLKEPIS